MVLTETQDAGGAVTSSQIRTVEGLTTAHKSLGEQFVANTGKVALWSASVGALYTAVGAVKQGFAEAISLDRQFATLQSVFKGTADEARGLMRASLEMGAAHGRAAGEAVEATIEWSRAQLTAAQAGEALRVSLTAANVAEISSAEAGKNLAAIYQTNALRITELSGVLGMMNSVSNTTKTTTKDLLDGFAQVGPLAAEAGISIAQTNAILGTTVANTARSGAQIGNTFKAVLVSLSDPRIQGYLRSRFGVESRTSTGDVKGGQTQLDDLFIASRGMNRAERGEMLVNVAGKHQASKVEAILENYPEAARKAIQSQLDLNSAQTEQNRILETTSAHWEKLKTQWASAFDSLHQNVLKSPVNGLMRQLGNSAEVIGNAAEVIFTNPFSNNDSRALDSIRGSYAVKAEDAIVQNDILNVNQSGARAAANKGIQEFIARTMRTAPGTPGELFAKDTRQLALTLERDPEKAAALAKRLADAQQNPQQLGGILTPYFRRAQKLEQNSVKAEEANRQFNLDRADTLERDLATNPQFNQDTERSRNDRERRKRQIELLRESGAPLARNTFNDDELGRRDALLLDAAAVNRARLGAMGTGIGRIGEGIAGRSALLPLGEIARLEARRRTMGAGADFVGFDADVLKNQYDLMQAGRRDKDSTTIRNFDMSLARIGGGTDALAQSRRVDLLATTAAGATAANAADAPRERQLQLVSATTAALREQQDIAMTIARTEAEIVSARERQNIEAGKALQMAGREDQARAALLQGFTQRNGQLSPETFQFLSSDFRQAAVRLNPGSVPDALTGAGEAQQSLAMLRETSGRLDQLVSALTPAGMAAQGVLDLRESMVPNLTFNMDISQPFTGVVEALRAVAEEKVNASLAETRATIERFLQTMRQPEGAAAGALGL